MRHFTSWIDRNIRRSVHLLEANRSRYPDSNYGERYIQVVGTTAVELGAPRTVHLGCGRDRSKIVSSVGTATNARFVGIDRDRASLSQYPIKSCLVADASALPLRDASCDLVISEEMFEHIENPDAMAAEVARVLKPGGRFVFATPNKFGYIGLAAWLTPFWFHRFIQNLLNPGRGEGDNLFPTFYRCNSKWAIERLMTRHGLNRLKLEFTEPWPWMLRLHPWFVRVGFAWGWVVQRFAILTPLRNRILGVYVRSGDVR
jgi:SAM-dependent methyltransferase